MSEYNEWIIQHHSTKLIEQQDEMRRMLRQTYPPFNTLNGLPIEDIYAVRRLIEDVLTHTTLLNEAVENQKNEPPKSF